MKICCLGSLNIDMVFSVKQFVKPKETIQSNSLALFAGGKGLNQAVAIKKSGVDVFMAGSIGNDGDLLLKECDKHNLDRSMVRKTPFNSGIAVIQVNSLGENCIILSDGANKKNDITFIDSVLDTLEKGDFLLLQNEINNIEYIIRNAKKKGIEIFLNPSPIDAELIKLPIGLCDYLILNEVEGEILSGESDHENIMQSLIKKYPESKIILTVGDKGAYYSNDNKVFPKEAIKVKAVDTTGAGDAFTGYFIGMLSKGFAMNEAIDIAIRAAAISVTRNGASDSIPYFEEVAGYFIKG